MSGVYYTWVDQKANGPFSFAQLREMWSAGTINAKTYVCAEGEAEWVLLSTIEHLFEKPHPVRLKEPEIFERSIQSSVPVKKESPAIGCFGLVVLILIFGAVMNQCEQDPANQTFARPVNDGADRWEKELHELRKDWDPNTKPSEYDKKVIRKLSERLNEDYPR